MNPGLFAKTGLIASLLFGSFSFALAEPFWDRCLKEDRLSKEEALGRVKWTGKCGLMSSQAIIFMQEESLYPSLIHENGSFNAPISEDKDCAGWRSVYAICPT